MLTREEAFALVRERIPNRNLVNHCVATEIIMEALASHLGHDDATVSRWGLAGLLHDLDYAETADDPPRHGLITAELLSDSIDSEMLHAILAHAEKAPLESAMDHALYAADPTTGFIVAAALIRPEKRLEFVTVEALLRRWKEKAFAKGASRDQMDGCAGIGMTREDFLGIALGAMQARSDEVGL